MTDGTWEGSVAVVTGGGRGIGLALARAVTARGARCALLDVEPEVLEEAAASVPGSLRVVCDVTDPGAVCRAAAAVADGLGGLRLLAANAGVAARARGERLWEVPDESWRRLFDVNVFGVVNTLRAFVPPLLARPGGQVLITASLSSYDVHAMLPEYVASKHAVAAIADTLRLQAEAQGLDLGVTTLVPGQVATDIARWREGRFDPTDTAGVERSVLSADQVADQVLEALAVRRPYVFTHPERFGRAEERFAMVAAAAAQDLATYGPSTARRIGLG